MTGDHRIPLIVVATLAAVVVIGVCFMGYLATTGTTIPDQLDRIIVGALASLGTILATTRATRTDEPPTEVTGPSGGPVETIPAKK